MKTTEQKKEHFCQLLASLFYPPDQELIEQIHHRTLYSFFKEYIGTERNKEDLLIGFQKEDTENLLAELRAEYDRLFSDLSQGSISLAESSYKAWTEDPHCRLPFASERGFLMGDSALHMLEIYNQCALEPSEGFRGCPDHIAMELEFLSYLYRWASDIEVKMFIKDHLNWIPLLKEEVNRHDPHPFYISALEVLDLFLTRESERLEGI